MNIVYRFFLFLLALLFFNFHVMFCSSINLFLRPAPPKAIKNLDNSNKATLIVKAQKKIEKLDKKPPEYLEQKLLKNGFKKFLPKTSGFISLYGGYVDYSDLNGEISFPLLHKKSKTYIIVTSEIELVNIHGNTFSHKNLIEKSPAKIYQLEKIKDKEQNITYWDITEIESTDKKRISQIALVILTKPKNIFFPTGKFITADNPNLTLPNVYVVGSMEISKSLINFLDIRKFFEQVEEEVEVKDKKFTRKIIKNK